jgi:tetratricopeptide (TPR) repeat protein
MTKVQKPTDITRRTGSQNCPLCETHGWQHNKENSNMKTCTQCNAAMSEQEVACPKCGFRSQEPASDPSWTQDPKLMNMMRACYFGTLPFYQGDYDRAIADYTELIQVEPHQAKQYGPNPAVFFNRGEAYRQKGEYDHAIADFTEAIRLGPKGADAIQTHLNRADSYLMKGRYQEAIDDCIKTIRLDSTNVIAYLGRGTA